MLDTTLGKERFCLAWGERDWWPLTRLLIVGLAFAALAHWRFGWNPVVRDLWALPGGILTILSFILLVSSTMTHVCLVVLAIPLCGIIMLNDWLYDVSHWTLRTLLRLRSRRLLATLGLAGEILLFTAFALALRRILLGLV